jgi:hypothetical protein
MSTEQDTEQRIRPIIRMTPPPPPLTGGGYNVTIAFDIDLSKEYKDYLEDIDQQPPEKQRPFLDDISHIAHQIMNGFMDTSASIDASGWGVALRKGRVIVNDVRYVTLAPQYRSEEEPF